MFCFNRIAIVRNPRRANDTDGREIAPPTIRHHLERGCRILEAVCAGCQHEAVIDVSDLPLDLPCPDVALRLRCSACGSRRIRVRMNMVEYYEVLRQVTGWQSPA
jgi:hypothetical protein